MKANRFNFRAWFGTHDEQSMRDEFFPYVGIEHGSKVLNFTDEGEDDIYATVYPHMNYTKAQAIEAFNRMVGV